MSDLRDRLNAISLGLIAGLAAGSLFATVAGSWRVACLLAILSMAFGAFLPNDRLTTRFDITGFQFLQLSRSLSFGARLQSSLLMVLFCSYLYDALDGFSLQLSFLLFLAPIILSSILFGGPVGHVTIILSLMAVLYLVIPPKYSLAIETIEDFLHLCIFFYVGLILSATLTLQCVLLHLGPKEKPAI